ncbi:MAG: SxtJ family membrane protein [Proteobacteria bacterium]|nr:SxtJ family membrane protein [Pseudomonadota bacterium]
MALIEINKNPSRRDLRVFGWMFPVFMGLVAGIVFWRFEAPRVAMVLAGIGASVGLLYAVAPPLRRPIYLGWIYLTMPIGYTISWTLLTLIYLVVLTPVGLLLRLFGKDPMNRKFDPTAQSYWRPHPGRDTASYFRQF